MNWTIYSIECPSPDTGTFGSCLESCTLHSDCSDGQLCCSNGCGHQCMSPVVTDPCAVSITVYDYIMNIVIIC